VASSPIARQRGTTDKRRTTTTNSSSSHHHDSAPSRPDPLICTGAEPIHPVHGPPKLPAWPWPPEMRSFSCHFGRVFYAFPFPHRFSAPSLTLLAQYLLPVPTKIKVEIMVIGMPNEVHRNQEIIVEGACNDSFLIFF